MKDRVSFLTRDLKPDHLADLILNAEVRSDPYPYFFIENFFSADFYAFIQRCLPDPDHYSASDRRDSKRVSRRYLNISKSQGADLQQLRDPQRSIWENIGQQLGSEAFIKNVIKVFEPHVSERYGKTPLKLRSRVELIKDTADFEISPHSDAPHKVFTLLFYLPKDASKQQYGTSVYRPKQSDFTSEPGKRFPFDQFEEHWRAPFLPNSVFGFMKNERSFHGRPRLEALTGTRDWMNCSVQKLEKFKG